MYLKYIKEMYNYRFSEECLLTIIYCRDSLHVCFPSRGLAFSITVPSIPNLNRYVSTILDMCARVLAGASDAHTALPWMHTFLRQTSRYLKSYKTRWCAPVGSLYTQCRHRQSQNHHQYIRCSPTAIKCAPESA